MSHRAMPPGGGAARDRVHRPLQVGARHEKAAYRRALHGFTHLNILCFPRGENVLGWNPHLSFMDEAPALDLSSLFY